MDLDEIGRLIDLTARTGVTRLELKTDAGRILIERPAVAGPPFPTPPPSPPATAPGRSIPANAPPAQQPGPEAVRAIVDGTVHLRPSPEAPPFVREGQSIIAGATLCLIEVMKTFHPVTLRRDATVARIAVVDGQSVRYDDVLVELA